MKIVPTTAIPPSSKDPSARAMVRKYRHTIWLGAVGWVWLVLTICSEGNVVSFAAKVAACGNDCSSNGRTLSSAASEGGER